MQEATATSSKSWSDAVAGLFGFWLPACCLLCPLSAPLPAHLAADPLVPLEPARGKTPEQKSGGNLGNNPGSDAVYNAVWKLLCFETRPNTFHPELCALLRAPLCVYNLRIIPPYAKPLFSRHVFRHACRKGRTLLIFRIRTNWAPDDVRANSANSGNSLYAATSWSVNL